MNIFCRVEVKDQEGGEATGKRKGKQGIARHIRHIEIRPEDRSREQAKGAGQSVDPVDQVESIDDNNDGGIRQHQAEGLRQLMDAEKSVHAVDADMRQVDQDRGCDHLPQKLFQGTQDHDIILKSQKEDDGGRCEKILEVRVL